MCQLLFILGPGNIAVNTDTIHTFMMFSGGVETGEEREAQRSYLTQKVAQLALREQAQDHATRPCVTSHIWRKNTEWCTLKSALKDLDLAWGQKSSPRSSGLRSLCINAPYVVVMEEPAGQRPGGRAGARGR